MAYALGFPKDVTDVLYSMRDWRLEDVRAAGGTPVARMLRKHVTIERDPPPATFTTRGGIIYNEWEWTIGLLEQMGERPCIGVSETPHPGLTYGYVYLLDECCTDLARGGDEPGRPLRLIDGGWPH